MTAMRGRAGATICAAGLCVWMLTVPGVSLSGVSLSASGQERGKGVDQFGRSHEVSATGTHTVIDFAAAWCEPCYRALPELQALADRHPEIRFLVFSVDAEVAGRDKLVRDLGLRLPVIWDAGHEVVERFSPKGFPATYVLDPRGEILVHHVGYSKKKTRQLAAWLGRLESSDIEARGRLSPRV